MDIINFENGKYVWKDINGQRCLVPYVEERKNPFKNRDDIYICGTINNKYVCVFMEVNGLWQLNCLDGDPMYCSQTHSSFNECAAANFEHVKSQKYTVTVIEPSDLIKD